MKQLNIDTVVLIDGGADSLMCGDEAGLGTPQEDMASIIAVNELTVERKLLACLGFGVDYFHGVCHAHFLEAVAELTRTNGYLGMFSILGEMLEAQLYRDAAHYVFGTYYITSALSPVRSWLPWKGSMETITPHREHKTANYGSTH